MFSVSACNINASHSSPADSDAGDLPMNILEHYIEKIEESLEIMSLTITMISSDKIIITLPP